MSTLDSGWILVAGLALFVAWFGWTLLRSGRGAPPRKKPAEPAAADGDPAREEAPALDPPVVTERPPEGPPRT